MKRLKFKSSLIPLVLGGTKTATWRMKDDKDLAAGDAMIFVDASTGQDFARAELTDVKLTSIHDFTNEDREGNVDFSSKEELLADFQRTYDDDVTIDTPMKIVRFQVTEVMHG